MTYDESLPGQPAHDLLETIEHDLSIIRHDMMAVLQETGDVRATMTEFSSWKPAVSKRFIVVSGFLCFMLVAAMVVYQNQLQAFVQWIGSRVFMPHS